MIVVTAPMTINSSWLAQMLKPKELTMMLAEAPMPPDGIVVKSWISAKAYTEKKIVTNSNCNIRIYSTTYTADQ